MSVELPKVIEWEVEMEESYVQTTEKQEREIPAGLSRMERAFADLFENIDALAGRLEPVLREEEPSEEKMAPRAALATDLGRALDSNAASVEGAALRLRALRDRVEL